MKICERCKGKFPDEQVNGKGYCSTCSEIVSHREAVQKIIDLE